MIGSANDFIPIDGEHFQYAGFYRCLGVDLPDGTIEIDYATGIFNCYDPADDEGTVIKTGDVFELIKDLPRSYQIERDLEDDDS
jgi:hypothetical protein